MPRVIIANNEGATVQELSPDQVIGLTARDEINGEHSLTLVTTETLEKQQRVLVKVPNKTSNPWREFVINGVEESHEDAGLFINTYYCVESWQYELATTILKTMPGVKTPATATAALTAALAGSRWSVGTVEPTTRAGASFYYKSGYEALSLVVENWGGEVEPVVTFDYAGVSQRTINLKNQIGSAETVAVFDYGRNVKGISRIVEDGFYTCRITPRGAAIESDNNAYGRKIDITSVEPQGREWIQDNEVVSLVRIPNGSGYIYPNQVVEYEGIDDPQTLYNRALADLQDYTRPRVSYEIEALALYEEISGATEVISVELGDTVQVIDYDFSDGGLRQQGRVAAIIADYLNVRNNVCTVGVGGAGLPGQFKQLSNQIGSLNNWRDLLQGALSASDTGDLTATGALAIVQDNLTDGTTSPTATGSNRLKMTDKNGKVITQLFPRVNAAGWQGFSLEAVRAGKYHNITLGIDASGNPVVTLATSNNNAPAAWRKALGLSYAAGDTWTMPSSATQMPCAGMITSGNTAIYFFIPLDRRIDATSCTVSGNVSVRSPQGYLYPDTAHTSTYYFDISATAINTVVVPGGIRVMMTMSGGWVTNSSGAAATGNRNVSVALLSNFKVTFA